MIIYFIAAMCLLALAVDIYIYRRAVGPRWNRIGRIIYVALAVTMDLAILVALLMFRSTTTAGSTTPMHLVLWAVGLFFANFVPKFIYALLSLVDYPARWCGMRNSHIFGIAGTVGALFLLGMMLWGLTLGRSRIQVKQVELTSEKLPESFDGLRVVVFADVHMGNLINRDRFLRKMVDQINTLDPDVVIQAGDIVNIDSRELDAKAMEILSGIKSRCGVYSVLGNHDLTFYIADTTIVSPVASMRDLYAKQALMSWHLLVNQTEYIVRGDDSIAVSGINFPAGDKSHNGLQETYSGADLAATYRGVPDSIYNIMISHTPKMWEQIMGWGRADLTVSGHVHAMQMKYGLGRCVWSPAKMMYKHWSGLYEHDGRYLYVNDGLGYVMYPMRINVRPEITLITLRRR